MQGSVQPVTAYVQDYFSLSLAQTTQNGSGLVRYRAMRNWVMDGRIVVVCPNLSGIVDRNRYSLNQL